MRNRRRRFKMSKSVYVYMPELSDIIKIVLERFHSDRLFADELDFIGYGVLGDVKYNGKIMKSNKKERAFYKRYISQGEEPALLFSMFIAFTPLIKMKDDKPFLSVKDLVFYIDHELMHLERIEKNGNVIYKLVDHDIEDFIEIIRRWYGTGVVLSGRAGITLNDFKEMIKPSKNERKLLKETIKEIKHSEAYKNLLKELPGFNE